MGNRIINVLHVKVHFILKIQFADHLARAINTLMAVYAKPAINLVPDAQQAHLQIVFNAQHLYF
jgi:hypothetical protein